jgi:hypothetical protein
MASLLSGLCGVAEWVGAAVHPSLPHRVASSLPNCKVCFSSLVVANEGKASGQPGNLKLIPFTVAQRKQRSEYLVYLTTSARAYKILRE